MPYAPQNPLKRKENFLKRAEVKHGNKFDYSKFEYVTAKKLSIIICNSHGEFQQSADKHLNTTHACSECWKQVRGISKKLIGPKRASSMSLETYLSKLELGEGFTVEIIEYENLATGRVTLHCSKHGSQSSSAKRLLYSQYKCSKCGWDHAGSLKHKTYESFLVKAHEIFGNKYTYPDASTYKNRQSILTINCPLHGDFQKKAEKHLAGQACHRCKLDQLIASGRLTGGYDKNLFSSNRSIAEAPALVYYLKVGKYWKIGITRNKLNERIRAIKSCSRSTVEVLDTFACSLEKAYELEQFILSDFIESRVYRSWSTELFSEDVLNHFKLEDFNDIVTLSKP